MPNKDGRGRLGNGSGCNKKARADRMGGRRGSGGRGQGGSGRGQGGAGRGRGRNR